MGKNIDLDLMQERLKELAEDLQNASEELAQMARALADAMESEENGGKPVQGFQGLHEMLKRREEVLSGTPVVTKMKDGSELHWTVIEGSIDGGRVAVQLSTVRDYRAFSGADKRHPWGSNDYETSELAHWLDGEFLKEFHEEDANHIQRREGIGQCYHAFWLLSAGEAGLEGYDEDEPFEWYSGELIDADEARQLKDTDGDPAYWWLRTPTSGHAYRVRSVTTAGAVNYGIARGAHGVAPACYIL